MYNKVDFANSKNPDEPTDNLGFLGVAEWYREKKLNMSPISEREFVTVVAGKGNKLKEIMFTISQIDKDRNGYVTKNELDDILKLFYRE